MTDFCDDWICPAFLARVPEKGFLMAVLGYMFVERMLGWANANLNSLRILNFDYPRTLFQARQAPEFYLLR